MFNDQLDVISEPQGLVKGIYDLNMVRVGADVFLSTVWWSDRCSIDLLIPHFQPELQGSR